MQISCHVLRTQFVGNANESFKLIHSFRAWHIAREKHNLSDYWNCTTGVDLSVVMNIIIWMKWFKSGGVFRHKIDFIYAFQLDFKM